VQLAADRRSLIAARPTSRQPKAEPPVAQLDCLWRHKAANWAASTWCRIGARHTESGGRATSSAGWKALREHGEH